MESLSEHEAMRVLQAAAAMDAMRAVGIRPNALAASRSAAALQVQQQPQPPASEIPQSPSQGIGEDVWRELAESEGGELKRHGDLDSWTDVFRATAASVRNAWRHVECLSYESLAFGWLALARKHEPLQVAPPAACGEDVTAASGGADSATLAAWLDEAQWAQAAYQAAGDPERLTRMLGLQSSDLLALQPESSGARPAFFLAVHHGSRTVRLVVRGSGHLRDLLSHVAGHCSPLGPGFAHQGMLSAAEQLLVEAGGGMREALERHPGYGLHFIGHSLGAGTAALLALLVSLGDSRAQQLRQPGGGGPATAPAVRATCFAAPPVVTGELAEQCAAYVDSIVHNADLASRCSSTSLRRLANEMSAASEEVLARSELAQALRRSGALGLVNHMVAAALCRCQPPQDAAALGPHAPQPPAGTLTRGPGPVAEGLTQLGGTLVRPMVSPGMAAAAAGAITAPLVQTSGRAAHLTTLGPRVKTAASMSASISAPGTEPLKGGAHAAVASHRPPSPTPEGPPAPTGPPSGTLPPLITVSGAGAGATNGSPHRLEQPPRKHTDSHGVLSPPPLVAAAAAASSQTAAAAAAAAAAAVGPTPTRRGLVLGDVKAVAPHDGRTAAPVVGSLAAAAAGMAGADGGGASNGGGGGGNVLLEPLAAPPTLPPAGTLGGSAAGGAGSLTGQRRDALMVDGVAILTGAVVSNGLPPLLPPLLLPPVNPSVAAVAATNPSSLSPRTSRQASLREGLPMPQPLAPLLLEQQLPPNGGEKPGAGPGRNPGSVSEAAAGTVTGPQQDGGAAEAAGPSHTSLQHELLVPGCVHMLERRGADATASFRLLRDFGRVQLNRILLKRSMLRDHLLSHYIAALERLAQQH